MRHHKLKPGDTVEVLGPIEIMKILDSNGTLKNLPFMPEMIRFCGKTFKIKERIEKTCAVGFNNDNLAVIRGFKYNDVVSLDELRCDGSLHGGCQIGCKIFWKDVWLKKSNGINEENKIKPEYENELRKILKTKLANSKYLCQSTNLFLATIKISMTKRLLNLIHKIYKGEVSFFAALKRNVIPILRKFIKFKTEDVIKGNLKKTPSDILNLQPGEIVEVKPFEEILKTLDEQGKNKGLGFSFGMKEYCGKQLKVRNRLENMIDEVTGELIKVNNSVILEGVNCKGCPRASFHFWREIWLKRIDI